MFDLAHTVWPRFGGDRAHRSLLSIPGVHAAPTWRRITLPASPAVDPGKALPAGAIVASDGTLRVTHTGLLLALEPDGTLLWQVDLVPFVAGHLDWLKFCSLPLALAAGETLLYLPDALLVVDRNGQASTQKYLLASDETGASEPGLLTSGDPGFSPNLTYSGLPLISTAPGEVHIFKENRWLTLGNYGYDVPMPAVYADDSLAVAGYYGAGFCRVNLDGSIRWTTSLREADLIPTLNYAEVAAVGSLNSHSSAFFERDGTQIGEYPYPARFAVHPTGGWMALSEQRLALLDLHGKEIWACPITPGKSSASFIEQPLVDSAGFSFVRQQTGFLCCDPQGRKAFEIHVPGQEPGFLSIVAPGTIAFVAGNELFLGHS